MFRLPFTSILRFDTYYVKPLYHKGSTVFCSQFEVMGWHEKIGDPTLADAIVDRIVHDAYTIIVEGKESMRKKNGFDKSE
jgi:DNA replication protein DnaC